MDSGTLVIDDIEAGKEFLKRLNSYRRVEGACWLRGEENETRYLHVALKGLTSENSREAYSEVSRITREIEDYYIDSMRVKLITDDDSVAKDLQETYRQYGIRKVPTNREGMGFGGTSAAELYIYAPAKWQN